MQSVKTLIVGAGVSGLATAAFLRDRDLRVLEADAEVGGYCKTVQREGFTWDYSGHFFHFNQPALERWLRDRMPGQRVRTVQKKSFIRYAGRLIDFPFQKNIHQLPQDEFIDCLYDLYFAGEQPGGAEVPAGDPGGGRQRDMKVHDQERGRVRPSEGRMSTVDPREVRSREDLAQFVRDLAEDFKQRSEAWENADLGPFLEAMCAWIEDMDGYYRNKGEAVSSQPEWRTLAEILAAARVYE